MVRISPSKSPTWKRHGDTCKLTTLKSLVGHALGDGVLQMYVCDPDGYIVELFVWGK
jgi:hypothetical protein